MALALEGEIAMWDARAVECLGHEPGLGRRHDGVVQPLQEQHGAGDLVGLGQAVTGGSLGWRGRRLRGTLSAVVVDPGLRPRFFSVFPTPANFRSR